MPTLAPDALEELITTSEAADDLGCTTQAISNWVRRGHLKAAGLDEAHRPLYRRIDVLRAERATRRAALGRRAG